MPTVKKSVPVIGLTAANGAGKTTSLREVVSLLEARGIRVGVVTDMFAEPRTDDLDLVLLDLDHNAPAEIADFIVREFAEPRTRATSTVPPPHEASATQHAKCPDPPAWLIEGRY